MCFAYSISDASCLSYATEVLSSKEFDFQNGKNQLCHCDALVLEEPAKIVVTSHNDHNASETTDKLLILANMIDLQSFSSIGCASAVFCYMQRRRNQIFLPHDTRAACVFRIMSLEMVGLDNVVYINADTLTALQIVGAESHPSTQSQGSNGHGAKESLSVYGLFHSLAQTPQGKRKLRQAFIRPSKIWRQFCSDNQASGPLFTAGISTSVKSW